MCSQENPFWDWSLVFYQDQRVQSELLRLQNEFALDVNLVLWCFWMGEMQRELSREQMQQVLTVVHDIQYVLLEKARRIRRSVKGQDSSFYQKMLDLELSMERFEQNQLMSFSKPIIGDAVSKKQKKLTAVRLAALDASDFISNNLRVYIDIALGVNLDLSTAQDKPANVTKGKYQILSQALEKLVMQWEQRRP